MRSSTYFFPRITQYTLARGHWDISDLWKLYSSAKIDFWIEVEACKKWVNHICPPRIHQPNVTEMFYITDKHMEVSGLNRTMLFIKTCLVLYIEAFG
jgi:hypothetical protein